MDRERLERFYELIFRKGYLHKVYQSLNEESENQGLLFLASALDDKAAERLAQQKVLVEKWLQEIKDELAELTKGVTRDVMSQGIKDYITEGYKPL